MAFGKKPVDTEQAGLLKAEANKKAAHWWKSPLLAPPRHQPLGEQVFITAVEDSMKGEAVCAATSVSGGDRCGVPLVSVEDVLTTFCSVCRSTFGAKFNE
jgi:hypothetical protein